MLYEEINNKFIAVSKNYILSHMELLDEIDCVYLYETVAYNKEYKSYMLRYISRIPVTNLFVNMLSDSIDEVEESHRKFLVILIDIDKYYSNYRVPLIVKLLEKQFYI